MDGMIVERHEFDDPCFNGLRSGIGRCIGQLRQSEDADAIDLSVSLKRNLYAWLAAPVEFDAEFLKSLTDEGDAERLRQRWGIPFEACIQAAKALIENAEQFPNPLREKVRTVITELRGQEKSFRIYCKKPVRPHFESIFRKPADQPLSDSIFIHSLPGYMQAELFDVLIKVGPILSKGISQLPDSILSAPKFGKLIQFVWSGCNDEDGVGMDPSGNGTGNFLEAMPAAKQIKRPDIKRHKSTRIWSPAEVAVKPPDQMPNEFDQFNDASIQDHECSACLVEIGGGDGWVITPYADVLSFDPNLADEEAVGFREVSSELTAGMFLIIPRTSDMGFGDTKPKDDLARIWKARLKEVLAINTGALCRKLKDAGVSIKNLKSGVKRWSFDATENGIHAPAKQQHFKKLISVLEVQPQVDGWWTLAWNEIRAHNNKAKQEGRAESQIERQEQLNILRKLLPDIRAGSVNNGFFVKTPDGGELNGRFVFYKILDIKEGYLVPSDSLRTFVSVDEAEEWREA